MEPLDPDHMAHILPGEDALSLLSDFFKTLGDQARLKLLFTLARSPLTVTELVQVTGQSQPTVSHQLAILKRAGLVAPMRQGRNVAYRLDDSHVHGIIQLARDHLNEPRSL